MLELLHVGDELSVKCQLVSLCQAKAFRFLGSKILSFLFLHNSTWPLRILYCGVDLFLSAVCKAFLSVLCKCSCSSRVAHRELDKAVSTEVFLVSNFGFTRPIRDYSSGPGNWDGGQV